MSPSNEGDKDKRLKAFFNKSNCANGDGIAVRGFSANPPLGSSIISISSVAYW